MEVWRELIRDYPDMRFWVAHNKTVPLEILRDLAFDQDWHVRSMVAMKRKLTSDILRAMANDEDEVVRRDVARHRRTPHDVLVKLSEDPREGVAEVARERLSSAADD